jgi:mono/diheme cytochrome c family protein
MNQTMLLLVLAAIPLLPCSAHAQQLGSPQSGSVLAQRICSPCHAVRQGEANSANSRSPTFTELASVPGMTSAALTVALTTPHAGMPMFMLTRDEREDIIAYILSLKR